MKPAHQRLILRLFIGPSKQTLARSGPKSLFPLEDVRRSLHSGPDGPPLPRVKGALALYWDPGMRLFSEKRLLFGRPEGPGTRPVRTRRSSPAWPSSWPLRRACCLAGCPRVLPLPQAWPPLEVGGPRVLPRPPPLGEEAPAQLHQPLPSRGSGLCVGAQPLLRSCPSPGLATGSLRGQPWLWAWLAPHSRERESVTLLSQGKGGRSRGSTVASREQPGRPSRASAPGRPPGEPRGSSSPQC